MKITLLALLSLVTAVQADTLIGWDGACEVIQTNRGFNHIQYYYEMCPEWHSSMYFGFPNWGWNYGHPMIHPVRRNFDRRHR